MLDQKKFLKLACTLALPIMIQNLISTLVSTADTVMLGYVSQSSMAAASLANQYAFVLYCIYYGLAIGTSVLCAQYWGKGDTDTIEKILGLSERISILVSALFWGISVFFPEYIMGLFTTSPETISLGAQYLRVVSASFLFMGFSQMYLSAKRSIGNVILPSVTYVVSLCVNILCNAAFIFGLFGLPKLGVVGVAIGTLIARVVEVVICLVHSAYYSRIKFRVKYLFARLGVLVQDFLKISAPAAGNDLIWSLATSVFTAILGRIGDDMVAANAVAIMVVNVGAIACRGFANATTIVVSQELGKNQIETAKEYGKRMLRITIVVSLLGCGVILAIRPFMLSFYADKLTPTALSYLSAIMVMTTWRLVGEGINSCIICGCFRGGGDSKSGLVLDTVFMWLVAVPLMALAAYVWKLPPLWVYFIMSIDEYEKMPVVFWYYKKYKWLNNITRDSV